MAKKLYVTKEWKAGKQDYYWNEYRQENDIVSKFKCHRAKFFDGKENTWERSERLLEKWNVNDSSMPDWLKKYL